MNYRYDDDPDAREHFDPDDLREDFCGCPSEPDEKELANNKCWNCGKRYSP
jgi:hypothetical protein